jgi:hypothetical protein
MTEVSKMVGIVEDYFAAEEYATLKFPDGWFGRPFDNQSRLHSASCISERLVLVFDKGEILSLAHPSEIESINLEGERRLRISGYAHGTWDYDSYGDLIPQLKIIASGCVEFVSASPIRKFVQSDPTTFPVA